MPGRYPRTLQGARADGSVGCGVGQKLRPLAVGAASVAELGECTLACGALQAMVKQANAAVRAKVDLRVFQVHRSFAAGTHSLGQACECCVIAELFASLRVRQLLGQLLLFQLAVQRNNSLPHNQHGNENANDVAYITAVTGQVRHQLDEKCE